MPEPSVPIRHLTREEANRLLPRVQDALHRLRALRDQVPKLQAKAEIEDLTGRREDGSLRPESRQAVEGILGDLKQLGRDFQMELDALTALGAHLKDLDRGLVDFYGRVAGETVFLCWKEGETGIGWYHPIDGGFRQRKPLKS